VADVVRGLDPEAVAARVRAARERVDAAARRAGRDPGEVELLAATKYVALEELPVLAQAGVTVVGENRAQDLEAKHAAHGARFTWDFIGHLQSRKVRQVAPLVRCLHAVASDSVLAQLARHVAPGAVEVLVEVNVAREPGKGGVAPEELDGFLERAAGAGHPPAGLMTMPPLAASPEASRRWFAALRELAEARGLRRLSMGTTQDFEVAVEEGATVVRLGSTLVRG
jgi:hypothetical protein